MDDDEQTRMVMEEGMEEDDEQMEMETIVQAEEDPDSRDSGISLEPPLPSSSQLSCCSSQNTLVTAIDHVDIHDDDDHHHNRNHEEDEQEDGFDENEDAPFQVRSTWMVDRSPLKKRLRSASGESGLAGRPTDFSSFHQSCSREKNNTSNTAFRQPESTRHRHPLVALSKSNDNWLSPRSASQGNHRLFTSTPSSFCMPSSSSSVTYALRSETLITTLSTSSTADSSDNVIPASVRSVHRVHSSSVLGYSLDQSWGSPDAFEHYSLITVERPQVTHRAFRSIDADTLVSLLSSLTKEQFLKRFILIDCRYPYEFSGGHIWYSENVWEAKSIEQIFYPEDEEKFHDINARIPIFYCEYSQKRGPKMAQALREQDRNRNEARYPYVDYKEIYLLDLGYRHFFRERQYSAYCTPQAYVPMWDSAHASQLKGYESHRRQVKKRRRKH